MSKEIVIDFENPEDAKNALVSLHDKGFRFSSLPLDEFTQMREAIVELPNHNEGKVFTRNNVEYLANTIGLKISSQMRESYFVCVDMDTFDGFVTEDEDKIVQGWVYPDNSPQVLQEMDHYALRFKSWATWHWGVTGVFLYIRSDGPITNAVCVYDDKDEVSFREWNPRHYRWIGEIEKGEGVIL